MVLRQTSKRARGDTFRSVPGRRRPDDRRKRKIGGRELDPGTRSRMEAGFGVDFGRVRVHTGPAAASLASSEGARAFALGEHVVFGDGQYEPGSADGRHLLAHELAHVVQQRRGGADSAIEERAARAADLVAAGGRVGPAMLGAAPVAVHRDDENERKKKPPTTKPAPKPAPEPAPDPSAGSAAGTGFELPKLKLTPPSLLQPAPDVASSLAGTLAPPGSLGAKPGAASKMPSRLSVFGSGRFSLGLRLGFPKPEKAADPNAPPSAAAEGLRKAEIINQTLTGKVPSSWESMDKGELAGIIWSIFATHIAPDVAKKITSGMSAPLGPPGMSAELDLILITDFSKDIGGGLGFTLRVP